MAYYDDRDRGYGWNRDSYGRDRDDRRSYDDRDRAPYPPRRDYPRDGGYNGYRPSYPPNSRPQYDDRDQEQRPSYPPRQDYRRNDYPPRGGYRRDDGYRGGYRNDGYRDRTRGVGSATGFNPGTFEYEIGQRLIHRATGIPMTVIRYGREQLECRLDDLSVSWFYESELMPADEAQDNGDDQNNG